MSGGHEDGSGSYELREYNFDLLPEELKAVVKKTPAVRFESIRKARLGIFLMHLFSPRVDTSSTNITTKKVKRPGERKPNLKIRIYEPSRVESQRRRLGMVFMHWGGFVVGNLATEHHRCVRLCRDENIVIISVDYRLAPENRFPLGLDDCETALNWFHDNCQRLGVDGNDIGVGGTSAGGGLAASLAIRDLMSNVRLVNFQYLGFPVLDQSCSTASAKMHKETPNWTSTANKLMWHYYLGPEKPSEVSSPATLFNPTGLPKTLIWTAEFDPLHDEALHFAKKLRSHGVETSLFDYRSCIHGFDSIPQACGVIETAHEHQSEFFKSLIHGTNAENHRS